MNYELAKKLKDAGFPQKNSFDKCTFFIDNRNVQRFGNELVKKFEPCKIPTLSELVKMCPNHCGLQKEDFGWVMYVKGFIREDTISTKPEEAVAKLLISIKEKKK